MGTELKNITAPYTSDLYEYMYAFSSQNIEYLGAKYPKSIRLYLMSFIPLHQTQMSLNTESMRNLWLQGLKQWKKLAPRLDGEKRKNDQSWVAGATREYTCELSGRSAPNWVWFHLRTV